MPSAGGYGRLVQQDLSGGMFPSLAPELIPPNGAYDITNGLLDEENVVYRRGGTTYLLSEATGVARMLWSGYLKNGGQQTLLFTDKGAWRVASNGTLANIGALILSDIARAQVFQGVLYLPGGATFDGATVGSVSIAGTQFYATAGNRLLSGEGSRIGFSNVPKAEGEAPLFQGNIITTTVTTTAESTSATVPSTTGLFVGMPVESAAGGIGAGTTITGIKSTTITLSKAATFSTSGAELTAGEANYHQLPGGVKITGMEGLRTSCVVFTTEGIWVINGLNKNLTDEAGNVQQSLDRYSADAVLWGNSGIAGWSGGLVVPCKDNVWLMQLGVSSEKAAPFVHISEPIQNTYRSYVAAGYRPGLAAVYRGHYFLPILNGSSVVDTLVCRLESKGYPWTHLSGTGAANSCYSVTDQEASFLGATASVGRVLKLSYFEPSASVPTDADGSVHPFSVTYRDIATGNLVPNLVGKARLSYRMVAPATSGLILSFGETSFGTNWDEFNWDEANWMGESGPFTDLEGEAKSDPEALKPHTWRVGRKVRYSRVKVSLKGPANNVSLRALELFVRADGRTI